jgi:hypothetical protein
MSIDKHTLISAGSSFAAAKLARMISDIQFDDVVRALRFSKQHSKWGSTAVTLGIGVVVGGAAALFLTPITGREARSRVAAKLASLEDDVLGAIDVDISNHDRDANAVG